MTFRHKFKHKPSKWSVLLFCAAFFFMCTSLVLGHQLVRVYRVNLFSKNLSLETNLFLRSKADLLPEESLYKKQFSFYSASPVYTLDEAPKLEIPPVNIDVPHISQKAAGLPNGCEAVSAAMLLNAAGYDISAKNFVDNYLPMEPVKNRWGFRYGPNPAKAYAGDPRSEKGGWGCFVSVIETALKGAVSGGSTVTNFSGLTLDDITQKALNFGIPVAIWITQDYTEVKRVYQWQSFDKQETYLYPVGQHCVVLKGYDNTFYYIDDPLKDGEVKVKKETLEKSFRSMGYQAIGLQKADAAFEKTLPKIP
ncbi:MAG: C39 family peptidase [Oscillospiraceae bacterium]|nr:C39 family peptidase [Oscillospiraceae bacterium]